MSYANKFKAKKVAKKIRKNIDSLYHIPQLSKLSKKLLCVGLTIRILDEKKFSFRERTRVVFIYLLRQWQINFLTTKQKLALTTHINI